MKARQQGYNHCKKVDGDIDKYDNPYKEGTEDFIQFRVGWNTYWNPEWRKE